MGKFKKKRKLAIGVAMIAVLTIGGIGYKLMSVPKEVEKQEEKSKTMAMYVEGEDGTFQVSNSKTFPTEGYVLDHAECTNGGTVTQDPETKKLSAKFTKAGSCNLYFAKEELTFLSTILEKANDVSVTDYNSGVKGEMFTFDHDVSSTDNTGNTYIASQISSWSEEERRDYRYIGANPNNWLKFNDEDWRIIGVFTVEKSDGTKEQLLKIIRNESIGNIAWDSSGNEWPNSSLNKLLNTGDYYNRANMYSSKGLNEKAKSRIEEVKWYLGGGPSTYSGLGGSDSYEYLGGSNYYSSERGITVYSGRSTNTTGKVGLMYPSDYVYTYANGVDNKCYTDGYNCDGGTPSLGWLFNSAYQWTISTFAAYSNSAFCVVFTGSVDGSNNMSRAIEVHPVVYLKSDIKIISGDGTSSETAYVLG